MLLTATAMLSTVLIGFVLWSGIETHSVQNFREQIDYWQPFLAGIRWMLIGSVALGWPYLCRWMVRSGDFSNDKAQRLTDLRWRVVRWLVAIELILGQSLLVKLMALMASKI